MAASDGTTELDPSRLREHAARVDAAGTALAGGVAAREAQLRMGSVTGWSAAAATGVATDRWSPFLGRLGGQVKTAGADMRTAADDYTAEDANAARLLDKAR